MLIHAFYIGRDDDYIRRTDWSDVYDHFDGDVSDIDYVLTYEPGVGASYLDIAAVETEFEMVRKEYEAEKQHIQDERSAYFDRLGVR